MRLISHDGFIDVPYEKTSLHIVGAKSRESYVIYANFDGIDISVEMGTYYSKEKALKVMEMVRNDYLSYLKAASSSYAFIQPKVFQFPADEDVTI